MRLRRCASCANGGTFPLAIFDNLVDRGKLQGRPGAKVF
jgi:hypothetical protein